MFQTTLKIEKLHGSSTRWQLLDDLVYQGYAEFRVPKGFVTDLSTNWVRGRHDEASVLHDYLLKQGWSFKDANRVMNSAMKDSNVRYLHRQLIRLGIGINGLMRGRK